MLVKLKIMNNYNEFLEGDDLLSTDANNEKSICEECGSTIILAKREFCQNCGAKQQITQKEVRSEEITLKNRLANFWDKSRKGLHSVAYTVLAIALFLSIWELLGYFNVLNEPQFFRPTIIFQQMWVLTKSGEIFIHIFSSLSRLLIAFLIAVVLGLCIGLFMGWNKRIHNFIDPLVTFFQPIPGIAWAPLIFIWVGFEPIFSRWGLVDSSSWWWNYGLGNPILIIIGVIAGIFPVIQNINIATRTTDKKLIWAAKTMGASDSVIFRKVLIPNSLPFLFTGLKLGLARCWRTIIATEFLSATIEGLGYFIFFNRTLETRLTRLNIYVGIFILAIVFYIIEQGIKLIEKVTIEKWGMVRKVGS